MKYLQYLYGDDANGEGARCTIFVSGCEICCEHCHNPESWKTNVGMEYTPEFENKIIKDLKSPFISGLSLSGGHPLHPKNFNTILHLCKRVKCEVGKSIWLWTGLTIEHLEKDYRSEIIPYLDVIIDGKYVDSLCDTSLQWRGSSNQRIIKLEEYNGKRKGSDL